MKILVDTDIGSDIDDALALSLLLRIPDAEIIGITTVSGKADIRACLVSVFTEFYGQSHIPVVPGASDSLAGRQLQPDVPQAAILDSWPHRMFDERQDAAAFLAECIHTHSPGVTLLSLGPLTNVAELIQRFPDAARRLNRLVTMSGRFAAGERFSDVPEWNILCDIPAARIVYQTGLFNQILCVGSDVTRELVMPVEQARGRLADTGMAPVRDMADIWFAGRTKMTFHDPLAAALLFNPDLCTYKRGYADIDNTTGTTFWTDAPAGALTVTDTVDIQAFFAWYFSFV
jgi:purine nucleosidase